MARYREHYEFYLALLWSTMLDVQQLSIKAGFFDLGGSASCARSMLIDVEREFGVCIPVEEFTAAPTVEALARRVRETRWARRAKLKAFQVPGTVAGAVPLVFVHTVEGELIYSDRILTPSLKVPVVAVRSIGSDMEEEPLATIDAMADRYVADLDDIGLREPYAIAGVSTSGVIALEMARRWEERGDQVAYLGLIEPPPPRNIPYDKAELVHMRLRELCAVGEVDFAPEHVAKSVKALCEIGELPEAYPLELVMRHAEIFALNTLACYAHAPSGRYDGHTVLYESRAFACGPEVTGLLSDPRAQTNDYEHFWSQYLSADTLIHRQNCEHRALDQTRATRDFLRDDFVRALSLLD